MNMGRLKHSKSKKKVFIFIALALLLILPLISFASATGMDSGLLTGLQAYLKFEDNNDSVGGIHNLSVNSGQALFVTGLINKSGDFNKDRIMDVLATSNSSVANLNVSATINFWYNSQHDYTNEQGVIQKNDDPPDGSRGWFFHRANTGNFYLYLFGTPTNIPTPTMDIPENKWMMITLNYNGTGYNIYINGTWVAGKKSTVATTTSAPLSIAETYNANPNTAFLMDEFGMWNRTLSQAELTQLFNNGAGLTYPGAVTYPPNIAQSYPINYYNTTSKTVGLGCNVTANKTDGSDNITSVSVSVYNSSSFLSYTNTISSLNTQSYNATWTTSTLNNNGAYTWSCLGSTALYSTTSSTRTFTIDTSPPNITIVSPTSSIYTGFSYADKLNLSLTYSAIDSLSSIGACWYSLNGEANVTLPSCNNDTIRILPRNNTLRIYANDTLGNIANSTIVYPYFLPKIVLCNSTINTTYINFTFKDEVSLAMINASISSSAWTYYLDPGITSSFSFVNTTENPSYAFCYANNQNLTTTMAMRYSNTGSPAQNYGQTIALTNSTTNKVLYLLPSDEGLPVTFQVVTQSGTPISGATITLERVVESTLISVSLTTDSAGTASFFLNPLYSHNVTTSKTGYATSVNTITPTQSLYTIILGGTGMSNLTYTSSIEGVYWTRTPASGVIGPGLTNFTFNVTSKVLTMVNCSFELLNGNKTIVLAINSTLCTTNGFLTLTRDVVFGETLYGRYFVDFGNGSVMLEGDGTWYTLYNESAVSPFSLKNIIKYMSDQSAWTSGGEQAADSKIYEFTKFMFFFLIVAIVAAFLNIRTNFDLMSPGYFLIGLPLILWIFSWPAFTGDAGFLYIYQATPFGVVGDSLIVALMSTLIAISLIIRRQRGLQS